MDHKIVWSEVAIADLHDICSYIAHDDPRAAQRIGGVFSITCGFSAHFRLSGRRIHEVRMVRCARSSLGTIASFTRSLRSCVRFRSSMSGTEPGTSPHFRPPNQTLETNCRPASPLDTPRQFGSAVHTRILVFRQGLFTGWVEGIAESGEQPLLDWNSVCPRVMEIERSAQPFSPARFDTPWSRRRS